MLDVGDGSRSTSSRSSHALAGTGQQRNELECDCCHDNAKSLSIYYRFECTVLLKRRRAYFRPPEHASAA
jgi:hypothetical protein